MQSAYHIAIAYPQASNNEKWAYLSKSLLGHLSFIPWGKQANSILRFETEEAARGWWIKHQKSPSPNITVAMAKVYVIKRIAPDKKEKSRRVCRIIKEL